MRYRSRVRAKKSWTIGSCRRNRPLVLAAAMGLVATAWSDPVNAQQSPQAAASSGGSSERRTNPEAQVSQTSETSANGSWGELSADVGFGSLGPDLMTGLELGWDITEGNLAAGLGAQIRFKTVDLGGPEPMGFRRRDWDEPSDFAHVLRYLTYHKDVGGIHLGMLAGELTGTGLGHSTLLSSYLSLADLDHPHSGAWFHLASRYLDLDLLAADFVRPDMFGGRIAARPIPGLPGLALGVTVMADLDSPQALVAAPDETMAQDKTGRYETQNKPLVGTSIDVQYRHREGRIVFVPYADGNWLSAGGGGLHAGLEARIQAATWKLRLKAEYHLAVGPYWSAYFDRFHDLQKYDMALGGRFSGQAIPKMAVLEGLRSVRHGGRWEAQYSYRNVVRIQAGYDLRLGPVGDLAWLDIEMPYSRNLVAGMSLAKTGLSGKERWKDDSGLLVGFEARWRIIEHLYLLGRLQHLYRASNLGYDGVWLAMGAVGGAFDY